MHTQLTQTSKTSKQKSGVSWTQQSHSSNHKTVGGTNHACFLQARSSSERPSAFSAFSVRFRQNIALRPLRLKCTQVKANDEWADSKKIEFRCTRVLLHRRLRAVHASGQCPVCVWKLSAMTPSTTCHHVMAFYWDSIVQTEYRCTECGILARYFNN